MKAETIVKLKAHAPLMALVTSNAVAWGAVGQTVALPYVTLQEISAPRNWHLKGKSDLVRMRVQIDCYATTQASAETIGTAVRGALDGQTFGPVMVAQTDDAATTFEGENPSRVWRRRIDFFMHVKEI